MSTDEIVARLHQHQAPMLGTFALLFHHNAEAALVERHVLFYMLDRIATEPDVRQSVIETTSFALAASSPTPAAAVTARAKQMAERYRVLFREMATWPIAEQLALRAHMEANLEPSPLRDPEKIQ